MSSAYYFRVGPLLFILNPQFSGIGNCYPRIFVRFPDNSYLNCDLSIGAMFKMSEEDWNSWLDGTEVWLNTIEEVNKICSECGINWNIFEQIIFELLEKNR